MRANTPSLSARLLLSSARAPTHLVSFNNSSINARTQPSTRHFHRLQNPQNITKYNNFRNSLIHRHFSTQAASTKQGEKDIDTEEWVRVLMTPEEGVSLNNDGIQFVEKQIVRPLVQLLLMPDSDSSISNNALMITRAWVFLAMQFEELGKKFDEEQFCVPLVSHWAKLSDAVSSPPTAEIRLIATIGRGLYHFYTKQEMMNSFLHFNKIILLNQTYQKRASLKEDDGSADAAAVAAVAADATKKTEVPADIASDSTEQPVKRKRGRPKKPETIAREEAERKRKQEEEEKEKNSSIKSDASNTPLSQDELIAAKLANNYVFHALYHRATIYSNHLQQSSLAVHDFDRAIELQPLFINSYLNSGVAYLQLLNDSDKAIEKFSHVIDHLDSKNQMALMNRATVNYRLERYDAALKDFNKVCELDPNNTVAWFSCARILSMSDPSRAKEHYDKCIALNPDFATPYYDRAILYLTTHDKPLEALEDLKKAVEINPNMAVAHMDMGVVYLNRFDNPSKALECLNKAIELDQNLAQAYYMRGTIYHRHHDNTDQALEDYSTAIELDNKAAEYYSSRASLFYENLDNAKQAIEDYTHAIELDPTCSAYYSNRGVVKVFKMGEALEGLKDFIAAVNLNPKDGMSYYNMASVYHVNLNKPDRALECYNKAVEVDPDNAQIFEARGYLFRDVLKNPAAASLDFERANMLRLRKQREEELKKTRLNVE